MRIRVRAFGAVAEALGFYEEEVNVAESITVRKFIDFIAKNFPKIKNVISTDDPLQDLVILVNGKHVEYLPKGLDTELRDGDSVLLIPISPGG